MPSCSRRWSNAKTHGQTPSICGQSNILEAIRPILSAPNDWITVPRDSVNFGLSELGSRCITRCAIKCDAETPSSSTVHLDRGSPPRNPIRFRQSDSASTNTESETFNVIKLSNWSHSTQSDGIRQSQRSK